MAGNFTVLAQSVFTNQTTFTVTHNLDRLQVGVLIRIGNEARNDLIESVTPDPANPRRGTVITLTSQQSGIAVFVDTDFVFESIPSPENTAVLSGGVAMTADVYDPTAIAASPFARANHTGNQLAATISDFDTEVGNNAAVALNTAKVSADGSVTTHNDVSDAGSGLIISGVERTKLTGIEPSADVTDATNVAAAGALMTSLADAKGDLFVATANDTVIRLPVGADTHVLTLDSAEASGVKWAAGGGGASGVNVEEDGVAVAGGPHDTLNFQGMEGADAGGGTANIKNVYGSEYESELDTTYRSTTSTSYLEAQKFTTASKPAGTYRIEFNYIWSYNDSQNNFRCRVTVDDTTQLYGQDDGGAGNYNIHQQEPKDKDGSGDGGTDQRFIVSYWADVTFGSSGTHEIDIDISSSMASKLTSIHRSTIAIYRVS
jgi:hypothetical protein